MPRSRVATTRAVSNAIDTVVEAAYQARDNVVAWHVEPRLLRDDLREYLAACVVSSFGAEADNRRGINAGHATGATQLTGSALVRLAAEMQTALRCKESAREANRDCSLECVRRLLRAVSAKQRNRTAAACLCE